MVKKDLEKYLAFAGTIKNEIEKNGLVPTSLTSSNSSSFGDSSNNKSEKKFYDESINQLTKKLSEQSDIESQDNLLFSSVPAESLPSTILSPSSELSASKSSTITSSSISSTTTSSSSHPHHSHHSHSNHKSDQQTLESSPSALLNGINKDLEKNNKYLAFSKNNDRKAEEKIEPKENILQKMGKYFAFTGNNNHENQTNDVSGLEEDQSTDKNIKKSKDENIISSDEKKLSLELDKIAEYSAIKKEFENESKIDNITIKIDDIDSIDKNDSENENQSEIRKCDRDDYEKNGKTEENKWNNKSWVSPELLANDKELEKEIIFGNFLINQLTIDLKNKEKKFAKVADNYKLLNTSLTGAIIIVACLMGGLTSINKISDLYIIVLSFSIAAIKTIHEFFKLGQRGIYYKYASIRFHTILDKLIESQIYLTPGPEIIHYVKHVQDEINQIDFAMFKISYGPENVDYMPDGNSSPRQKK